MSIKCPQDQKGDTICRPLARVAVRLVAAEKVLEKVLETKPIRIGIGTFKCGFCDVYRDRMELTAVTMDDIKHDRDCIYQLAKEAKKDEK